MSERFVSPGQNVIEMALVEGLNLDGRTMDMTGNALVWQYYTQSSGGNWLYGDRFKTMRLRMQEWDNCRVASLEMVDRRGDYIVLRIVANVRDGITVQGYNDVLVTLTGPELESLVRVDKLSGGLLSAVMLRSVTMPPEYSGMIPKDRRALKTLALHLMHNWPE